MRQAQLWKINHKIVPILLLVTKNWIKGVLMSCVSCPPCAKKNLYRLWSNEQIIWHGYHDDVIKWNHFPRNWLFVRGIHRSRWIASVIWDGIVVLMTSSNVMRAAKCSTIWIPVIYKSFIMDWTRQLLYIIISWKRFYDDQTKYRRDISRWNTI